MKMPEKTPTYQSLQRTHLSEVVYSIAIVSLCACICVASRLCRRNFLIFRIINTMHNNFLKVRSYQILFFLLLKNTIFLRQFSFSYINISIKKNYEKMGGENIFMVFHQPRILAHQTFFILLF